MHSASSVIVRATFLIITTEIKTTRNAFSRRIRAAEGLAVRRPRQVPAKETLIQVGATVIWPLKFVWADVGPG
jgi:hypothetical protein